MTDVPPVEQIVHVAEFRAALEKFHWIRLVVSLRRGLRTGYEEQDQSE